MKKLIATLAIALSLATAGANAAEFTVDHAARNDLARGVASAVVTKYVTDKTHSKFIGVGAALAANYLEERVFEKHRMNGHDAVTSVAGSGVGLLFTKQF